MARRSLPPNMIKRSSLAPGKGQSKRPPRAASVAPGRYAIILHADEGRNLPARRMSRRPKPMKAD